MRTVALVELVLLAACWQIFAIRQALRGLRTWASRLLFGMALFVEAEALSLLALGTGHALPLPVYTFVFGALLAAGVGWLWLQDRAIREERGR
jgi:hypothetical protein